ncbi:MAG: murein hydrolase activator EnvC family protein [Alphaproteobacteria bacterium]|jgi:septal ring factor EnvC (AmiA/AmiB activator)
MSRVLGRAILAGMLMVLTTAASDPEQRSAEQELRTTEQSLSAAEADRLAGLSSLTALQRELATISTAMQNAAADLRQHERTIAEIANSLTALEGQRAERQQELNARRRQVGSVLSALVRLTALPPEAALFGPGASHDRLRSAFLVRGMVPKLQARASLLTADIAAIRKAEGKIAAESQRLAAAKVDLEDRYQALAKVVERKDVALKAAAKSVDQTAALAQRYAKSAASLREFLGRVEAERVTRATVVAAERLRRAKASATRGIAVPAPVGPPIRLAGLDGREGGLIAPVTGTVIYRFGEGEGRFTEGVTLGATPDTPVLSPADGRVVYAGPFRDYGILLILEHGGGFHSVLTGLGRSEMVAGQWVLAGEPLGRVADHGSLYVEIRRSGRPVNPLAWFTLGQS